MTSTDDHGWHDIFMISYLVATLPWTLGCIALSPKGNPKALKYRKLLAGSFFGTLVPLIYFFIQHKVHKIAGGQISTYPFEDRAVANHFCKLTLPTPSLNGPLYFWMSHSMLLQL